MTVVFFTVAELAVLSTMLGGLLYKRAHSLPHPPAAHLAVVEEESAPVPT